MGRSRRDEEDTNRSEQKVKNAAAAEEGRVVYVRGIPPDWAKEKLDDFFKLQGDIESINLMPPKPGQTARAAFVNFAEASDAENAAQVYDNMQVEAAAPGPGPSGTGTIYRLACSLKKAPGQRVEMVSGFSDLSKARQERRCVYISGLPMGMAVGEVGEVLREFGLVEDIKELPATKASSRNLSCFAIMGTSEEAVRAIENLDGKQIRGQRVSVTFPKPPKRTRDESGAIVPTVEVRGFPKDVLPTEVGNIVEANGISVESVKILRHESLNEEAIALVHTRTAKDAEMVQEMLDGKFEFLPGVPLKASLKLDDRIDEVAMQDIASGNDTKFFDYTPDILTLPSQDIGSRKKGAVVGRLAADGPSFKFSGGRASEEGRSLLVNGIPPDWSREAVAAFFQHQGPIENVSIAPFNPAQGVCSAVVDFVQPEGARNAAQVCNGLPVEPVGGPSVGSFTLVCRMQQAAIQSYNPQKSHQSSRCIRVSGLPPGVPMEEIEEALSTYGTVERLHHCPRKLSYEVLMGTMAQAACVVRHLNGTRVRGKKISMVFSPMPGARVTNQEPPVVEIHGFPVDVNDADVFKFILETCSIQSTSLKIYPQEETEQAIVFLHVKSGDAKCVFDLINAGLEYTAGVPMKAQIHQSDNWGNCGQFPAIGDAEVSGYGPAARQPVQRLQANTWWW